MSFMNNAAILSEIQREREKTQFQPEFPLVYDGTFGPYRPITDKVESIQKDFENLLQTSPGEWPYDPELGVGLRHYLFEFHNSEKMNELEPSIRNQLDRYLPAVRLIDLEVVASPQEKDESFATIKMRYTIATITMAELAAQLIGMTGRLKITNIFHRGLFSSGDVYNTNASRNDIITT